MIEIENTKIALAVLAIGIKYTAQIVAQALPSGFEVWLDQGATVFCIAVLSYLLKQERDERRERQKHHDEEARALQQKQSEENAASIAMRERLAISMEKHSDAIDRLAEKIESK
jgi:hypothetical protein